MHIPAVACELHNLPHAYIGAVYFPKYMTEYWRSENTTRPFTVSMWSISSCSVQPVVFSTLPKQKNLPNCSGTDPQDLTNWGHWQPNNGARRGNSAHRSTQFTKKIFRRNFQMWRARRLYCRGATVLGGGGQRRKVREAGVSSTRIPSTARQISKQPESFQPCSGLGTPFLTASMVVGFRTWLTLRSSVHLPWSLSWSSTTSGHGCTKTTFFFFNISKTLRWYLSLSAFYMVYSTTSDQMQWLVCSSPAARPYLPLTGHPLTWFTIWVLVKIFS